MTSMTNVGFPLRVGNLAVANFPAAGGGATAPQGSPGVELAAITSYVITPTTIVTTAVAAAQAVAGAGNLTLNGTLATAGLVTFGVPRAVQIVSTNAGDTTQTATFTGKDYYGVAMTETVTFNGTTAVFGKKAFKTISQVAISAAMTGNASAGDSDVFGLPIRVDSRGYVLTTFWDTAHVHTGTFVAAVTTSPATATTGDVRGTYTPPTASNGTRQLIASIVATNPNDQLTTLGVTQA
jgi:hypothetical protein